MKAGQLPPLISTYPIAGIVAYLQGLFPPTFGASYRLASSADLLPFRHTAGPQPKNGWEPVATGADDITRGMENISVRA